MLALCDKAQINPPVTSTVAMDTMKDIIASSASVGGSPVEAWVSSGLPLGWGALAAAPGRRPLV